MKTTGILISVLLLLGLGGLIYFLMRKQKDSLKKTEMERNKKVSEREDLKISDPLEYEKLVKEDEERKRINKDRKQLWKRVRVGLIIFLIPHLIFEILLSDSSGLTSNNMYVPLGINFGFSSFFIRNQIFKKHKNIDNPILYGLGISMIVFSIRVVLGFLYGGLLDN